MTRQLPPAGEPGLRPSMLVALFVAIAALIAPSTSRAQLFHSSPTARPAAPSSDAYPIPPSLVGVDRSRQSAADVDRKSASCIQCHQGSKDPHDKATVKLGCTDCHGGNAESGIKEFAHVQPRFPEAWRTSGNPVRSYTLLNHESPEFTMFVNPGDLRVAHISCGTSGCHPGEVDNNRKSMMTHGAMLWGAALYNNGAFPLKRARYGESYSMNGVPQMIVANPPPSEEDTRLRGELPFLMPLPRFEVSQPANILRIFERGGKGRIEIGNPLAFLPSQSPGPPLGRPARDPAQRPRARHRATGPTRSTSAWQKTRLLDPTLNFLGTNDHAGRLPLQRLLGLPRHVRQRPLAGPLGLVTPSTATGDQLQRPTRRSPRTSPATRSSTSSSPRRRRASA